MWTYSHFWAVNVYQSNRVQWISTWRTTKTHPETDIMETWHVVYVVTFLEKLQQNIKPSFFCTTIDPDRPYLPSMMFGTGRKRLTETNECLVLESKIPFLWLDEIYSESIQLMSISPNGWKCPDEHGRGRNPMCPNMFKRLVILLHVLLRFRWGWCFFLLKLYPTATRSQGLLPPSFTSWRETPPLPWGRPGLIKSGEFQGSDSLWLCYEARV